MTTSGQQWIDLHLHSTASDGVYPPANVVEMAHARGLSAVALTDHETTAGLAEAEAAASALGVEFIKGIEIPAAHNRGTLDILGYFIDSSSPALTRLLDDLHASRERRNAAIIENLRRLGIDLNDDDLRTPAARGHVGRPHIAECLVRKGIVTSHRQAFNRYLASNEAAWAPRDLPPPRDVIAAISAAGGVASLAHPAHVGCASHLELETLVGLLRDAGLRAIEVHHPDHRPEQMRLYEAMARRYNLAITGGSDFHSLIGSGSRGVGFCRTKIPFTLLTALRSFAQTAVS